MTNRKHLIGGPLPANALAPRATRERRGDALTGWGIAAGLLMPAIGFVIAIVLLARGAVGPGLAVLLCCCVGMVLALAFLA